MTTIACDGKTLASDSQGTSCSYIHQSNVEKIIPVNGGYYAIAGDLFDLDPMIEAAEAYFESVTYDAEGNPSAPLAYSFGDLEIESTLLYMPVNSNKCIVFNSDKNGMLRAISINYPIAIGSGQDFAMGAMASGASAKKAIKAAIKLDPYSGGEVVSYPLAVEEGGA